MRIGVIQMDCTPGNIPTNIEKIHQKVEKIENADLVVLPELVDSGYIMSDVKRCSALPEMASTIHQLSKLARNKSIYLVAGIMENENNQIFNVAVVINPEGEVIAKYRKIHLYTPSGEGVFTAGNDIVTLNISGFNVGLMICYDTRFPEMARSLALSGAEVIIVPTAWPFPRVEHWQLLTRVRAIENQCYLIGANRVGQDANAIFCGNSRIIDPHGIVVSSASEDQEEIIYGDVSREKLDFVRNRMPVFEHRRADVYLY